MLGPHPEANSEYRIRTQERSYVIDRLIRDANGTQWVVDFKTSRHEGADIEGFLDREQKRYAAQLDAYSAARAAGCTFRFMRVGGSGRLLDVLRLT